MMHSILETHPDYHQKLVGFVRRKWPLIRQVDAEIIVSRAIESCLLKEASGRVLNWNYVTRATSNRAIDHIRHISRHPVYALETLPTSRTPSYTMNDEIRLALVKPSDVRQNHWDLLHEFGEGYTIEEVAQRAGISPDAAKKQMSRGRAAIRRHREREQHIA